MSLKIINNVPEIKVTTDKRSGTITITIEEEKKKTLGEYSPGDIVRLGKYEFIVLAQVDDHTELIAKAFVKKMAFGATGDYARSDIREYLNTDFYRELCKAVGTDNILKHEVDVTALDGTEKGVCEDFVSLLTMDRYRAYRELLPEYGEWWYTATRFSADVDGYARGVCYVRSRGVLSWSDCDYGNGGVRPFCVLKSSTLVS